MIEIQVKIGEHIRVRVTGEDSKRTIEDAAFFSELPDKCPICQFPTAFQYRTPQDYQYYGMRCAGTPAHDCNFGQKREGGGLFYKGKDSWRQAYSDDGQSGGGDDGGQSQGKTESEPPVTDDDIPF